MPDYGVTPAGFVRKPDEAILEEMAAAQRASIDPAWTAEDDELAGQYNGIFTDQLSQLWEALEATYAAGDRAQAEGAALDNLGELTSTPREGATKSTVTLSLSLNGGITVPAGSIVSALGNPSARFITLVNAVNSTGVPAARQIEAEAITAGPVVANAGQLTVIETPVSGWTAVTNPADADPGQPIESDTDYRARQQSEIAAQGGGTLDGLRSDVSQVLDVTAALALENTTADTVDGMPPHSFELIVEGGEDQDIADSIWGNKPAGILAHGSTQVTVTDSQGMEHVVGFSRPSELQVFIAVDLVTDDTYDGSGDHAGVKEAIRAGLKTPGLPGFLGIGVDVYAGRVVCAAIEVRGVLNASAGLSFTAISAPEDGTDHLAIAERELAGINTPNMDVDS